MKAFVETIKYNVLDVVTASGDPCGAEYTPQMGGGCASGIPDDE